MSNAYLSSMFTHSNALRRLNGALWVQIQVDAFASDSAAFRGTSA